jgi:hypothetical protein
MSDIVGLIDLASKTELYTKERRPAADDPFAIRFVQSWIGRETATALVDLQAKLEAANARIIEQDAEIAEACGNQIEIIRLKALLVKAGEGLRKAQLWTDEENDVGDWRTDAAALAREIEQEQKTWPTS